MKLETKRKLEQFKTLKLSIAHSKKVVGGEDNIGTVDIIDG